MIERGRDLETNILFYVRDNCATSTPVVCTTLLLRRSQWLAHAKANCCQRVQEGKMDKYSFPRESQPCRAVSYTRQLRPISSGSRPLSSASALMWRVIGPTSTSCHLVECSLHTLQALRCPFNQMWKSPILYTPPHMGSHGSSRSSGARA